MIGKVVLITGASSGIGAGAAVHFAAKGCLLSLTGRSETGLENTLQACVRGGSKKEDILLIKADLLVVENLAEVVEKTVNRFGRLDVLVNNAGCVLMTDFQNTSVQEYETIMNTNLRSVFFLTQAALPHLVKSKGNVVNVSSLGSHRFLTETIAYCMSKCAMDHFTKILALDVAAKNVRVNSVNPGGIKTPIIEKVGVALDFEEMGKQFHAMRRGGTVDEVSKAIVFMADDEQSSFITGVTLLVDGGANLLGAQLLPPTAK